MFKKIMDSNELKELGLEIKKARKERGISEPKLAEHIGCSNNTLRKIESGKGGQFQIIIPILRYLKITHILKNL